MAKFMRDPVPDAMLAKIATCNRMTICSAEPANYAGIAAVTLAQLSLTAGAGNGDWTIADGDVSGRKITKTAESGISISANGTATHIVFDDGTTLLYGTTCTSQVLTSGGTVSTPAFDAEIADPT